MSRQRHLRYLRHNRDRDVDQRLVRRRLRRAGRNDLVITNASSIFSGVIDWPGDALLQAGTQILSGNNTYTGATTINGGTLQVDGSLTASATTVNAGGTLAGDGTVQSVIVNSGGHVAPGSEPGIAGDGEFHAQRGRYLDIEIACDAPSGGTQ